MYELCGRTKPGGGKCESPALRGKSFCYYHEPQAPAPCQSRQGKVLSRAPHAGNRRSRSRRNQRNRPGPRPKRDRHQTRRTPALRAATRLQRKIDREATRNVTRKTILAAPPEDRSRPRLRKNLRHREAAGEPGNTRRLTRETELLPCSATNNRSTSPESGLIAIVCGQMRQRAGNTPLSQMVAARCGRMGSTEARFRNADPLASLHRQSCGTANAARSRSNRGAA